MPYDRRGITLIELLLVLALIGIILTVAWPRLDPLLSRQALNRDAQRLAWMLRSAKQTAITTGKSQTVTFHPYGDMYKYSGEVTRLSSGVRYIGTTTFKSKDDVKYCSFNAEGHPSFGGTVTLGNDYGQRKYIIVSVATGRIRVSDQPPWEGET